jgi:hypothetical protein
MKLLCIQLETETSVFSSNSRVRFPPPPLFIGKATGNGLKNPPSENRSENKSTHFQGCSPTPANARVKRDFACSARADSLGQRA